MSSLVWSIEVKGNQLLTETEVLDAANESGLTRWTLKWGLEPGEVEAGIAERLPLVSWTGVYINGTRVIIEVAERVLPEDEEKSPAHLVAAKAGIIKEVLVLSGNPLVYEGDTVAQGQVLISGEIPALWEKNIENGAEVDYKLIREADYVHAKGIVRARVWYESYGQAELIETGYRLTGRFQKRYVLRYNDTNEIILWGGKDIAYVDYETETDVKKLPQWRNIGLPVEIITVKYLELSGFCEERSLEGAAKIAEEAAVEAIVKQFPQDAVVQGRWMEDVSPANDENIVKVKVAIETVEDIGEEKLFNP